MNKIIFLFLLLTVPNISLGQRFKDKIMLSGMDYFFTFVDTGGNPGKQDMSSFHKIFIFNDTEQTFMPILTVQGSCKEVVPNPAGDKLAVLTVRKDSSNQLGKYVLQIIDTLGRTMIEVSDVFGFEWFPGKDMIAYVSGVTSEDNEIGGFGPTGVWILNLTNMKKEKISDNGYWVSLNKNSSKIYIDTDQEVDSYDLTTKKVHVTNLLGNRFSPNGKYYFREVDVYRPIVIYNTKTNIPVALQIDSTGQFAMWLKDKEQTLIVGDYDKDKKIIDVATGKVFGTISGKILGNKKARI